MRRGLRKIAKYGPKPTPEDSPIDEALMAAALGPPKVSRKPRVGPKPMGKPKPRPPMPALRPAVFRVPTDDYVSPHDGTPVRAETGPAEFVDNHGNRAGINSLARGRHANRIVKWFTDEYRA